MNQTRRLLLSLALMLSASLVSALAQATMDRIELVNGSVIVGTFVDADGGQIIIDTDFAGTLKIDQTSVVSMNVQTPVVLQMEDGAVLDTEGLIVAEQTLTLDSKAEATYALEQLMRINPEPWELGRGYNSSGIASTAFTLQRGNTVIDELDYKIDTRWTGLRDRFTLQLDGEVREANRERTAENWMVTGKYDRFQVGDYYWGIAASAEENRFADLNLRTRIGPYMGRSLFESSPFVLELESGLSQVNEDFNDVDDRSYVGLTWSLRSESDYLGNNSRLYVDHSGVKNLAEGDNLILDTTVGLSLPLIGQLQGAAELVLNYNSGAVAGTEELDQTYRFRLGYSW